jgi:hypothetical protein
MRNTRAVSAKGNDVTMRRTRSIAATLLVSVLLVSCATTGQSQGVRKNSLPAISETGSLAAGDGILLVSAGRKDKASREDGANFAGILPFISYHILRVDGDTAYEELAFIPAEAGFSNQLGKDYYGFIHFRELPAGDYVAVGNATRGQSLYAAGMILAPGNRTTEIAFGFSIEAGKINYIGELMTMRGFLRNEDIRVADQQERDAAYLHKKHAATADIPVRVQLAEPANIDDMPVPEVLE